jgi:hypothetical protein
MSEEELHRRLAEAGEKIARLQNELERVEKKLKRTQSGVVWSGWLAVLVIIAFFLGRTLFPKPAAPPAAGAPPPVVKPAPVTSPKTPSKPGKIPVYDPPPSVSEPASPPGMPGFSE